MAPKRITGVPGWFGGTDYYGADGAHAGTGVPNLISGSMFCGDGDAAGIFANGSFEDE